MIRITEAKANHRTTMTCYACSSPATSQEHVPPRCFFPRSLADGSGARKQLITVPSCDAHNQQKSNDDDYFRMIMVGSSPDPSQDLELTGKTVRGLMRNKSQLWNVVQQLKIETDEDGKVINSQGFEPDHPRILRSFYAVARGIFFHEFGKRLTNDPTILCPTLFAYLRGEPGEGEERLGIEGFDEALHGLPRKGDVPSVFSYRGFGGEIDDEWRGVLDMCFYRHHRVIAITSGQFVVTHV